MCEINRCINFGDLEGEFGGSEGGERLFLEEEVSQHLLFRVSVSAEGFGFRFQVSVSR